MVLSIGNYSKNLKRQFDQEKDRLKTLIGEEPTIEHIGSTAVGIGGKNIIDILIGVKQQSQIEKIKNILMENGYFAGFNNHPNRIFLASSEEETSEGDFHIHLCLKDSEEYQNFILIRDYLLGNPGEASRYFEKKNEFAKDTKYNREEYKSLKSKYVSELLKRAKK